MTLQKIEFMYDVPDGYRFLRYDYVNCGEIFINNDGYPNPKRLVEAEKSMHKWIVIEKIPKQPTPQPELKLQYKTQHGDWRDVNDGYEYRIKPKARTVRFRNFLHSIGIVLASDEDISDRDYFKRWLGDWQEVEVEEND